MKDIEKRIERLERAVDKLTCDMCKLIDEDDDDDIDLDVYDEFLIYKDEEFPEVSAQDEREKAEKKKYRVTIFQWESVKGEKTVKYQYEFTADKLTEYVLDFAQAGIMESITEIEPIEES